ncbi:hypothetical protein PARC_a1993 [Pseudoalteromonas arctica A 37-1-2]|uniref:Uncharacterized protein n=1 Tax=Pseudoalteromonas arctica A 37-1-2 TaxID=1117313 RepID=A0A290S332_9GAMM|nr:hypothetical protein PARC_a1993 [Pseudoalteromonas arctica A 37-1-2]
MKVFTLTFKKSAQLIYFSLDEKLHLNSKMIKSCLDCYLGC